MQALFLTCPHAGEQIPPEVEWLQRLSEEHLMRDVDRYVDRLYRGITKERDLEFIVTDIHRYVVDLNRSSEDIESLSVEGVEKELNKFHKMGLHWVETTQGEPLLTSPMSKSLHLDLVQKYWKPFYSKVQKAHDKRIDSFGKSFQLDCHSMPSLATAAHTDSSGSKRPRFVISDYHGVSSEEPFRELVLQVFKSYFSDTSYNSPYVGGKITQHFGNPERNQNCIQIEIRRDLYMNEDSKMFKVKEGQELIDQLNEVIGRIKEKSKDLLK
ncbi:MAG: N-formylglutamate amidohydrolase [Bdellovibrionales bacterium]